MNKDPLESILPFVLARKPAAHWTARFPRQFDPAYLRQLEIGPGPYLRREDGVDLVDAAAWLAGDLHGPEPDSVCPFFRVFLRGLGMILAPEDRQAFAEETLEYVVFTARRVGGSEGCSRAEVRGRAFAVWAYDASRGLGLPPTTTVALSRFCWSQPQARGDHAASAHVSAIAAAGVEFARLWLERDPHAAVTLAMAVQWLAMLPAAVEPAAPRPRMEGGAA